MNEEGHPLPLLDDFVFLCTFWKSAFLLRIFGVTGFGFGVFDRIYCILWERLVLVIPHT